MNNIIGHVLRSRKHPPLGNINVQRNKRFHQGLKPERAGWDNIVAGNSSDGKLYVSRNRISQRASRAGQGIGFQRVPLFALESFLASILARAGAYWQHLLRPTIHDRKQCMSISLRLIRSFSSRRPPTGPTESVFISEAVEAQVPPGSPTLSEVLLQDGAIGPQRLQHEAPTSAQSAKFNKPEPRNREEMQTLIMFLKELSDPTEIKTLDSLFYHYRALPAPRLAYLHSEEVNLLLSRFMSVPVRTDLLMTRFLSIIDDMRELKIPISRKEWITVVSYVGQRFNLRVGLPEIEASLKLWSELEKKAGTELEPTLFNILLDMAAKANQYNLVHAILAEMKHREIRHDRFTLTTLITWYGILKDAASVRETFTKLVQNGEMVDTVVYNALIVAFMRAGEWDTAEELFDRMKNFGANTEVERKGDKRKKSVTPGLKPGGSPVSPSRDYVASRRIAQVLKGMAKQKRQLGSVPGDHGSQVYCGPNIVTFNIFLQNHCSYGDFEKVTTLLTEMKRFKVSLEPSIYLSLFRGFTLHARWGSSKWTRDRIEEVYAALLRDIYQQTTQQSEEVRLSTMLACEVVKAFAVTTRSRAKTIKVYRDMEYLYQQGYGNDREIDPVVQRVLQKAIGGPIPKAGVINLISGSSIDSLTPIEVDEDKLVVPKL